MISTGNKIRGYIRLALIVVVSAFFLVFVTILVYLPWKNKFKVGQKTRMVWSRICLAILNFKVEVQGKFPKGRNYLYVGNHRSSLDPFIFLSHALASPVSRG